MSQRNESDSPPWLAAKPLVCVSFVVFVVVVVAAAAGSSWDEVQ